MKLTYIGPLGSVSIPLPNGRMVECAHGEICEVPDEIGERLLEQEGNWEQAFGGEHAAESVEDFEPPEEDEE